jgi:hypothetical protein
MAGFDKHYLVMARLRKLTHVDGLAHKPSLYTPQANQARGALRLLSTYLKKKVRN